MYLFRWQPIRVPSTQSSIDTSSVDVDCMIRELGLCFKEKLKCFVNCFSDNVILARHIDRVSGTRTNINSIWIKSRLSFSFQNVRSPEAEQEVESPRDQAANSGGDIILLSAPITSVFF